MYRRKLNSESNHYSPTLLLLVIVATIGAMAYFSFLMRPENRGDLLPYIMVVTAESFIIFHALTAMWTILAGTQNPRHFGYHYAQARLFSLNKKPLRYNEVIHNKKILPSQNQLMLHRRAVEIDVFITVYGEPANEVYNTAIAARDMAGVHDTIILDDGASDEIKQIAEDLQIGYIRRNNNLGAKAGNINNALSLTEGEYFVIFDADFVAKKEFLYETMPFFEDPNVAFVQTPQYYSNQNTVISRGAGFIQSVFYKLIQPGKNRFNAAFCVGTNVVFRRRAIESIGGIYEKSKSEDIWTSILLHEKGYRSVFITDVLAVGQTPDTIKAYSKQQLRWATGGFEILLRHNPLTKKLTLDQKLQYFHTITYYLHGLAILLLILLPPIAIYFDLSPVTVQIAFISWLLFYLSFYGLQVLLAFYTMGGFRTETIVLAMASFPIYIRAFINALLKKDEAWQATGNRKGIDSPFNYIIPQILIFIFLFITSILGVWKVYYYETFSLALFWCLINTFLLGSFILIALKEHRLLRRSRSKSHAQSQNILHKQRKTSMAENTNF